MKLHIEPALAEPLMSKAFEGSKMCDISDTHKFNFAYARLGYAPPFDMLRLSSRASKTVKQQMYLKVAVMPLGRWLDLVHWTFTSKWISSKICGELDLQKDHLQ